MSVTCPNKRLNAWKDLVKVQGEDAAYMLWDLHEGVVPNDYYKQKITEPVTDQEDTINVNSFKNIEYKDNTLNNHVESLGLRRNGKSVRYDTYKEAYRPVEK